MDETFRNELIGKRARLAPPTRIGSDGRIMEWLEEYAEPEPHHRHVSHLWGLYPGDEISTSPALAQAARKSLEARGDDGVGWSLAYKAALWARLGDGNHAWQLVQKALNPASGMDMRYDGGGGVYPNLFDACPPFPDRWEFWSPGSHRWKCCCKVKLARSFCCLRCRMHGRTGKFLVCAPAADFK